LQARGESTRAFWNSGFFFGKDSDPCTELAGKSEFSGLRWRDGLPIVGV